VNPDARDAPTLVLLPGLDGTGRLFAPVVEAAEGRFPVSVARYPTREVLGYPELVPHARRAIPEDRPFVLVAESFSGPLAIEIAARGDAALRGIVFAGSFARNPGPLGSRLLRPFASLLFRRPPSPAAVRRRLAGEDAPDELVDAVLDATGRVERRVLAHRLRELLAVDARPALRRVEVPILYLAGSRDRLVGRRGLRGVRSVRPGVTAVVMDAPHLILQRRPEEALDRIGAWLRGRS
jgi:pimeloyl-ACP methyl ester carboxylesterase